MNIALEPEIKRLRALARKEFDETHIDDYDDVRNGDKVKEEKMPGKDGETRIIETNQSNLWKTAVSTTREIDLLMIEAELVESDEHELNNYHIPETVELLEKAKAKIENEGLEPAWQE